MKNILVDGISFIEKLSFNAFNEGTRLIHCLKRVKARTKLTEILYIFFGIHTANVVQLADRIEQRARLAAA